MTAAHTTELAGPSGARDRRIVLVINSGSSSLKYQLLDMASGEVLATGLIDRIGLGTSSIAHEATGAEKATREAVLPDHEAAFDAMLRAFAEHGPSLEVHPPIAIGHRVVHGGRRFLGTVVIDDDVERNIEDLIPLAPLHNPANLAGIRAARHVFPDVPHTAVFDTAFHTTMSDASSLYAIDRDIAERFRVRKYGFHGTSHQYVSRRAAEFLGIPLEESRIVVLHIGNGASMCAVAGGRSVETSMGMTPLEGLVMGTRSGDLDPAVLAHLHRQAGLDIAELDDLLNRRSGLLGLAGSNDMRDVLARRDAGDEAAATAFDVYVHRLRHYLGAYLGLLGGADAVVFTAGVGENSAPVREATVAGFEWLGIELDAGRNAERAREARRISTESSRTAVLVVPTNEELEIAQQTLDVIGA